MSQSSKGEFKAIVKLIDTAIDKARDKQDSWNLDRYVHILNEYMRTKKITMAEYMDVKLYLGHSMD